MRVVLPRHRSASAVLLAKTGLHAALDGPSELVVGQPAKASVAIDNWSGKAASVELTLPGAKPEPLSVAAGASVGRPLPIPAPRGPGREAIPVGVTMDGRTAGGDFEFYVDRPLEVSLRPREGMVCQGEPATASVDLFSPLPIGGVQVEISGEGVRVEPASLSVDLAGRAKRTLEFRLTPLRPGKVSLTASARSKADRSESQRELTVFATAASAATLKQVRSGSLLFEVFGCDHGAYKNKPVLVNGVEIGVVPQQTDSWAGVEMPLTPEAIASLGENNEVRIENRVGDAFKVRNFRLRLQGPVGLISELNSGAFTSCGWEYAEGTVFKLSDPLTGIRIRIPPETATPAR
jgi:hypothetical protein